MKTTTLTQNCFLLIFIIALFTSCTLWSDATKTDCTIDASTPEKTRKKLDEILGEKVTYDKNGSAIMKYELVVRFVDPTQTGPADISEKYKKIDYIKSLGGGLGNYFDPIININTDDLITDVTPCMCGDELLVIGLNHELTDKLGGVIGVGETLEVKSGKPAEAEIEVSPNYIILNDLPSPQVDLLPASTKYLPIADEIIISPLPEDSLTGNEVIIAVLDTGIALGMEIMDEKLIPEFHDLNDQLWVMNQDSLKSQCLQDLTQQNQTTFISYDVVNSDGNPFDLHSHGTHVTGIITRQINEIVRRINEREDFGINYKIMPIKTHDRNGVGTYFDVLCGTYFAVKNGANVINDSWGFYGIENNDFMDDALDYAKQKKVFVVTALGNDKNDIAMSPFLPSNFYGNSNVITVGAYDAQILNRFDYRYSNYNSTEALSLLAPGTGIASLMPNGTEGIKSGTSMAAPHITAAIAIQLARTRNNSFISIKNFLYNSNFQYNENIFNHNKEFIRYNSNDFY